MSDKRTASFWPLLLAALAFLVIGALYWRGLQQPLSDGLHTLELPAPPTPVAPPREADEPAAPPPAVVNPVEQSAAAEALAGDAPPADPADADQPPPPFEQALEALLGAPAFSALVVSDDLVNRIVVAIDNLPNEKLPVRLWPLRKVGGQPEVLETAGRTVLAANNASRYTAHVQALAALDMRQLAALYVREYPRFQAAYRALGYSEGYFNDRLVDVIDHLLVTPDLAVPPTLVRPKALYLYADEDLESRSLGQKVLLRIGPANAGVVKSKLRELRRLIIRRDAPPKE
ncbi:MAG: DUF3014 domain-containing protein [Gammaproteobacteria bacterium]|nr:DUF3014 domain-containing protein [Gammaproteobacteria bacterium]